MEGGKPPKNCKQSLCPYRSKHCVSRRGDLWSPENKRVSIIKAGEHSSPLREILELIVGDDVAKRRERNEWQSGGLSERERDRVEVRPSASREKQTHIVCKGGRPNGRRKPPKNCKQSLHPYQEY